jgi:hypothetical protein
MRHAAGRNRGGRCFDFLADDFFGAVDYSITDTSPVSAAAWRHPDRRVAPVAFRWRLVRFSQRMGIIR